MNKTQRKFRDQYFALMAKAYRRKLRGYTERHHIIPRSLGGGNERSNLVTLTLNEHFKAHVLLTKFMTGNDRYKMLFALARMIGGRKLSARQREIAFQAKREAAKAQWENPELRKKMSAMSKALWKNPEHRKKMSAMSKALWKNPEDRKKQSARMKEYWENADRTASPSSLMRRSAISAEKKAYWSNTERRKKQSARMKAMTKTYWSNPENRKKHGAKMKTYWSNPENRKKHGAKMKTRWANPDYRKKMKLCDERRLIA